jgi:ATP-dependent DNA helicase RecQ
VVITDFGEAVMRERDRVELALPDDEKATSGVDSDAAQTADGLSKTVMETYALYRQGIEVSEIATRRGCTLRTIEGHLEDCVRAGLEVDIAQFVPKDERVQIEKVIAVQGTDKLKPIREALPDHITYPKIRLVIAELQRSGRSSRSDG